MYASLFFLSDVRYGGFVSYTAHLCRALRSAGITARIFKIRERTERKARMFCAPYHYQNIDIGTALASLNKLPGLIVCCNWKKSGKYAAELLERGVPIVIHDPTEMHPGLIECIKENPSAVIVIRKTNREILKKKHGIKATFIPHPYTRAPKESVVSRSRAASISRVDFDKHTDMIIGANNLLASKSQIQVYGFVNRIYDFHKLSKLDDDWRRNYRGAFELSIDAGVTLARQYQYIVDMSAIKGDGGGTQYTFFEAWDAGSVLVLNQDWVTKKDAHNIIVPGENALVVDSAEELASVIRCKKHPTHKRLIHNGRKLLKDHSPAKTVGVYTQILSKG